MACAWVNDTQDAKEVNCCGQNSKEVLEVANLNVFSHEFLAAWHQHEYPVAHPVYSVRPSHRFAAGRGGAFSRCCRSSPGFTISADDGDKKASSCFEIPVTLGS